MSATWAIRLPMEQGAALGRMAHVAGLSACVVDNDVWVRGDVFDETFSPLLRGMAHGEFFWIELDGEQLRARDARIPTQRLPQQTWRPLAEFLDVSLPSAGWPAEFPDETQGVALRLEPAADFCEPNLLLTTRTAWSHYAVSAPQVRLSRWQFATSVTGEVLIHGEPLPPLPGQRFVARDGIATPAGWTWQPAVDVAVVRQLFQLSANDLALWRASGECEIVRAEQFVAATRSAVRATCEIS